MIRLKYLLGVLMGIPCLPLIIRDGKRIRSSVPSLPEAENPKGIEGKSEKKINLLSFGESTLAGVGIKDQKDGATCSIAKVLAKELDAEVNWKVMAHSGYTMERVLKEILPKADNFQPDIIVTAMGGNDAFMANSPQRFARAAGEFIEKLQARYPNIPIVFMNMPPIKDFPAFTPLVKFFIGNLVELHGQALDKTVEKHDNVFYISEIIAFQNWINKIDKPLTVNDLFSDGVHPSGLTYQLWGRETGMYILENEIIR
ncbi:MAG: lysophospholipase L1-like esterase [Saprospiraceae bacterium]|jgi:lysophospholipase L1-like esterase